MRAFLLDQSLCLFSSACLTRECIWIICRLLLMSATMREDDFAKNRRLFHPRPSVLAIPASTFDVQIHFSRQTKSDYVDAAVKKVLQIHT